MNGSNSKILVVDDSPVDIHILMDHLRDDFKIAVAKTGHDALAMLEGSEHPDAILLDVTMPLMSGYEICEIIKSNPKTADIDVIFISANDSIEEKLKGFDCGGSDYLIKPVEAKEIKRKVFAAVKNSQLRQSVEREKESAMGAALSAINDAGELATVVSFLRQSFEATSLPSLAKLIVDTSQTFGLASSVQIRTELDIINLSNSEPIPPLEIDLMYRLKDSGRIHQRGRRLILNFGPISQIVKNLPDDPDKCGRLRDHLAVILEGARSRYHRLVLDQQLLTLMQDSQKSLANIKSIQHQQKINNVEIVDRLFAQVQQAFVAYGLSEEQEDLIISVIKKAVDETLDNYDEGLIVDKEMEQLIEQISYFLTQDAKTNNDIIENSDSLLFF